MAFLLNQNPLSNEARTDQPWKSGSSIYFYDPIFSQQWITNVRANYHGMRDFHGERRHFEVFVYFYLEWAAALNASLIFRDDIQSYTNINFDQRYSYPTILPLLSADEMYSIYHSDVNKHTLYLAQDSYFRNFVYCEAPYFQNPSQFTHLSSLLGPFDKWIWTLLLFSVILIPVLLTFSNFSEEEKRPSSMLQMCARYASMCLVVISSLFSNPWIASKSLRRSHIFTVWLITSAVVLNYYTGFMTSMITRPPTPITMTNLEDLLENNFTLVFRSTHWLNYERAVASFHNATVYKTLLDSAIVRSNYIDQLERNDKKAYVNNGAVVLGVASIVQNKIRENYDNWSIPLKQRLLLKKKVCNVGKTKIIEENAMTGILPPWNGPVANVFQRFVDAGIYRFWRN